MAVTGDLADRFELDNSVSQAGSLGLHLGVLRRFAMLASASPSRLDRAAPEQ
jgi:hypothetical protein